MIVFRLVILGAIALWSSVTLAIIPRHVTVVGDAPAGWTPVNWSGTVNERTNYVNPTELLYRSGTIGGVYNLTLTSPGDQALILREGGTVRWSNYNLDGETGSIRLPDDLFNTVIGGRRVQTQTNVVVSWGGGGVFSRVQNTTRYPVTVVNNGSSDGTRPGFVGFNISPMRIGDEKYSIDCTDLKNSRVEISYLDHTNEATTVITQPGIYRFKAHLGRIRIKEQPLHPDLQAPIFGDMLSHTDMPLYSRYGQIIYSDSYRLSDDTNITASCEWRFEPGSYTPQAYINGICVCPWHSPDHIVAYNIASGPARTHYDRHSGTYIFDFTMQLVLISDEGETPDPIYCTFSAWLNPSSIRATYSGTTADKPRFRATFNRFSGVWSMEYLGNN